MKRDPFCMTPLMQSQLLWSNAVLPSLTTFSRIQFFELSIEYLTVILANGVVHHSCCHEEEAIGHQTQDVWRKVVRVIIAQEVVHQRIDES